MFRGHNTYSTPGAGENADTEMLMDDLSLCLLSVCSPDVRSGMGKELYDTMAQGPHGKMGLHLKFKTIFNSVMREKGLFDTHGIK
ncbi:MAG: hypothetical protein R3F31_12805 [Verrucomicrobiales bacterium]